MTVLTIVPPTAYDGDPLVAAAIGGDDAAFTALVERHRRELHAHCSRILKSFDQAEDVVQETLLRAWRARSSFAGRSKFRTWLYQIATNACMDELDRRKRRPQPRLADDEPADRDRLGSDGSLEPDGAVLAREALESALAATLRWLPRRQRAVLVLCHALRWSAAETAELLGMSVAAVNSALQRARATLDAQRLSVEQAGEAASSLVGDQRALLDRYVDAVGRADAAAVVEVAVADAGGPDVASWRSELDGAAVAA